jgi:hypothetical protein
MYKEGSIDCTINQLPTIITVPFPSVSIKLEKLKIIE